MPKNERKPTSAYLELEDRAIRAHAECVLLERDASPEHVAAAARRIAEPPYRVRDERAKIDATEHVLKRAVVTLMDPSYAPRAREAMLDAFLRVMDEDARAGR